MHNFFKKSIQPKDSKLHQFLEKYNLPRAYFHINRKMVARGVAFGLFWALIPMPMQMLAVVAMTPFVKFNVPLALAMVWLSNPFTMPIMYYIEYLTGTLILGYEGASDIEMTLEWFTQNMSNIFIPLYVGTAFYLLLLPPLFYFIVQWLWIRSVQRDREKRGKK
jgi:uncharacterized protein (DUF2062 family)